MKSEPRISSTVPGATLGSSRSVTLVSSFFSVLTAAISAAEGYSITELV